MAGRCVYFDDLGHHFSFIFDVSLMVAATVIQTAFCRCSLESGRQDILALRVTPEAFVQFLWSVSFAATAAPLPIPEIFFPPCQKYQHSAHYQPSSHPPSSFMPFILLATLHFICHINSAANGPACYQTFPMMAASILTTD